VTHLDSNQELEVHFTPFTMNMCPFLIYSIRTGPADHPRYDNRCCFFTPCSLPSPPQAAIGLLRLQTSSFCHGYNALLFSITMMTMVKLKKKCCCQRLCNGCDPVTPQFSFKSSNLGSSHPLALTRPSSPSNTYAS